LEVEHPEVKRIKTVALFVSFSFVSLPVLVMSEEAVPHEIVRVVSADIPEKGCFNWKFQTMYYSQEFRPVLGQQYVERRTALALGAAYSLADRVGAGITGELVRSSTDSAAAWWGTIDFEAKVYVYKSSRISGGVGVVTSIPVYDSEEERGPATIRPTLLLTLDSREHETLPPYRVHLNAGYEATTADNRSDDLFVLGIGVELLADEFAPFMEFTTEQSLDDGGFSLTGNPARLTPGITWTVTENLNLTLGLDLSLSKPPVPGLKTVEDWNVTVGVSRF
jgi:hypothetical protein